MQVAWFIWVEAEKNSSEIKMKEIPIKASRIYLRVDVTDNEEHWFSYSIDGKRFEQVSDTRGPSPGVWIGAKVGLFSSGSGRGYADYDWLRFGPRITRKNAD